MSSEKINILLLPSILSFLKKWMLLLIINYDYLREKEFNVIILDLFNMKLLILDYKLLMVITEKVNYLLVIMNQVKDFMKLKKKNGN
jgi:hypothetical protein